MEIHVATALFMKFLVLCGYIGNPHSKIKKPQACDLETAILILSFQKNKSILWEYYR